jgi:hypothetical protein
MSYVSLVLSKLTYNIFIKTWCAANWFIQLVGCFEGNCFYNDTPNEAIKRGALDFDNPLDIKQEDIKLGIHNWQSHGIAGRGVLIDMVSWYTRNVDQLPYDPWKKHAGKYRRDIARGIRIYVFVVLPCVYLRMKGDV